MTTSPPTRPPAERRSDPPSPGGRNASIRRNRWAVLPAAVLAAAALPVLLGAAEPIDDLPLPDGQSIRFQPVFLGVDPTLLASREFTIGESREGSVMKEHDVRIGGSFLARNAAGKTDWCYYLSQTEVTAAQWAAVTGEPAPSDPLHPKTGISFHDVQNFLAKYNTWLRSNERRRQKLPQNEESFGYLRLPTEAEWEFACRGGAAVDPTIFKRKSPYPDSTTLKQKEWVSGSDSSVGKLKPVTSSEPTVLKLYGMLGNAAEMTESLFCLDYYSGRVGGYVVRGASIQTLPDNARSSMRIEQRFYQPEGLPSTSDHIGFRLAIGSEIYCSKAIEPRLAQAKNSIDKTERQPTIDMEQAREPTADAASEELEVAMGQIDELKKMLSQLKDTQTGRNQKVDSLFDQIGLLQGRLENAEALGYQRDRKIAAKSAKMVSGFGRDIVINGEKIAIYEDKMSPQQQAEWILEYEVWKQNFQWAWDNFRGEIEELANVNAVIRRKTFDRYQLDLRARGLNRQANAFPEIRSLTATFRKGVPMNGEEVFHGLQAAEKGQ